MDYLCPEVILSLMEMVEVICNCEVSLVFFTCQSVIQCVVLESFVGSVLGLVKFD